MWIAGRGEKVLKLALYAHGGLNGEQESIRRIRVLGPCFEANGIYPLFLTWKTGAGETIADMVQDWARRNLGDAAARSKGILDALGEAKDRALEAAANVLFKGIWTEMRENAEASMQSGRGLALLLKHLAGLAGELAAANRQLELHMVGHSAGSILLGHFLQLTMAAAGVGAAVKVKTCTLYAAACSSSFANARYLEAGKQGVLDLANLHLYVLRDEEEKADALPAPALPAYGKSLLYLVSRALDDVRKQPLLGLERALLPEFKTDADQWAQAELGAIQAWQKAWPGAAKGLLHRVPTPFVTVTRQGAQVQATHGSFDNNIAVLGETLERIRGGKLVANLEWLDY
jgi:hypothetical protein